MKYVIITMNSNGEEIAALKTPDINIAAQYVQSEIERIFYEEEQQRVGLWDDQYGDDCDGGFYAMAIHEPGSREFEILTLEEPERTMESLYVTRAFMTYQLEK